jgi:hypothetical protein
MVFIVSRTSDSMKHHSETPPCDEAFRQNVVSVDVRTTDSPTKIPAYKGRLQAAVDMWYGEGTNHRVEFGQIKRDFVASAWCINIDSLDELMAFYRKYGSIIIEPSSFHNGMTEIQIYDDYLS